MSISNQDTLSISIPADFSIDNLDKFNEEIVELLKCRPGTIVIDTSQLVNVTSSHVGALWQAYLRCADIHVAFKLKAPSPLLVRILKMLDLDTILSKDQDITAPIVRQAALKHASAPTKPYVNEFQACAESVDEASEEYAGFLVRHHHIPEIIQYDLRTVFYEIATNIRTHSGLNEQEIIVFTFSVDKNKAVLIFADSGNPFNPTEYKKGEDLASAIKSGRTRGFGIPMLLRMTDNMTYNRLYDMVNVFAVEKSWE